MRRRPGAMAVRVVLLLTRLRSATWVARDRGGRSYGSGRRRLHGVALPSSSSSICSAPSLVSPSRVLGTAPPCSPGALGKGGDQRLVVYHQLDGRTRSRLACCAAHLQLEDPPVPIPQVVLFLFTIYSSQTLDSDKASQIAGKPWLGIAMFDVYRDVVKKQLGQNFYNRDAGLVLLDRPCEDAEIVFLMICEIRDPQIAYKFNLSDDSMQNNLGC
ncbi:hypothetical protein EJB05_29184 [Eragrostis curvula]|uniref:Uncharacterized protein n=1 Tax=Eragrostis curvula TaxID=38414 RepID=A0A5J9UU87_9POAL|nr:hypothetical protein EJB05_29184 [Eragrostis curvula]